jgi:aldehyde dehydrogenase (NAD+)
MEKQAILSWFDTLCPNTLLSAEPKAAHLSVISPIDGNTLGFVQQRIPEEIPDIVKKSQNAFQQWKQVPAPKRGELVRLFGEQLRQNKKQLGALVTLECGKILEEGLGEVQEMIDMCDFATGLSRQLYGKTIASERLNHRVQEIWHPLGPVGIITAFNFPVAVWAWNASLALVCGNSILWKPSEKTPLTALACQTLLERAIKDWDHNIPEGLSQVIIGNKEIGHAICQDTRIPLISATGSCAMGAQVSKEISKALGRRSLLELGGNNAAIITPSANLDLALKACLFSAVGTAGQRCTTLRRAFIHESLFQTFTQQLEKAYQKLPVGNPLEPKTLVGPLIDQLAFHAMEEALHAAQKEGGKVVIGGQRVLEDQFPKAFYVHPALIQMNQQTPIVQRETFAPILYCRPYTSLEDAIELNNAVPQGLSSCIFTQDLTQAEAFLSAKGSDCGLANVNIGTSGAEIGGAFGGEKETGGGREAGSDSWKAYMRRSTQTIHFGKALTFSQGIQFDLGD